MAGFSPVYLSLFYDSIEYFRLLLFSFFTRYVQSLEGKEAQKIALPLLLSGELFLFHCDTLVFKMGIGEYTDEFIIL